MKDGSPVERQVPKILKDRLKRALFHYGQLGLSQDEAMELIKRDASNFRKCIAVWGVKNIGAPVPDLDLRPFPLGYREAVEGLREVCDELSHFLNGGAEDYCAAPITRIVEGRLNSKKSSIRASAPRKKKEKTYARGQWKNWQANPSHYPNKQKFIEDVVLSNEITQNQARAWFNEFRAEETSPDWEIAHGKKYPRGKDI